MYMGDMVGCHEVPEPICPRCMTFDSLAPRRTAIPVSDITTSEPLSILIPGMFMPGMLAILCFLTDFLFLVVARFFCGDDFLLMPGMFFMSWPRCAHATKDNMRITPAIANNRDGI